MEAASCTRNLARAKSILLDAVNPMHFRVLRNWKSLQRMFDIVVVLKQMKIKSAAANSYGVFVRCLSLELRETRRRSKCENSPQVDCPEIKRSWSTKGERRFDLSFQPMICYFEPIIRLRKTCSVGCHRSSESTPGINIVAILS